MLWYKRFGTAKQIQQLFPFNPWQHCLFSSLWVDPLLTTYVEVVIPVYLSCHLACKIEESVQLNYEERANFHCFRRLRVPKQLKLMSLSFISS